MALSTGWTASRLAPRTGLPGTPLGGPGPGAATPQQNPIFAQIAQMLGIKPPVVSAVPPQLAFRGAPQMGPLPAAGVDYLARAGTAGTPAERVADQIATAAEIAPAVAPRSAAGTSSQSGNIVLPNSVYRAASTPLQAGLAKAIGIPSPTIVGTPIASVASPGVPGLSGGLAPGVSPLAAIAAPQTQAVNTTIPGVTNFNTLANQNQNMPPWLMNAIQNLNNPDNFLPPAPVGPAGGGFDPLIGSTMAATEARIAAQQKALAEENKARIARVKADAAAAEHAHELQVQRQRRGGGGINYQSGWGAF